MGRQPPETSRGDSENKFSESPRDREKMEFLDVPYNVKSSKEAQKERFVFLISYFLFLISYF